MIGKNVLALALGALLLPVPLSAIAATDGSAETSTESVSSTAKKRPYKKSGKYHKKSKKQKAHKGKKSSKYHGKSKKHHKKSYKKSGQRSKSHGKRTHVNEHRTDDRRDFPGQGQDWPNDHP
jgi:hypothetical protein